MPTATWAPVRAVLLAVLFLIAAGAAADETRDARLDRLFAELGDAADEQSARRIENDIWLTWLEHDEPRVNRMIDDAMQRRREQDLDGALAILDELATVAPDYAEVWNQRAYINFLLQDYESALIDVAETLKLEPRHFAALAGRGVIRLHQGKPALGYQSILAAMKIHPFIRERELVPRSLREGESVAPAN